MGIQKVITIKQPWASLIVEGLKNIENRTWPTRFRGRVLIHSSAKSAGTFKNLLTDEQFYEYWDNGGVRLRYSSIIGSVEIVDCVVNHPSIWAEKTNGCYKHDIHCEKECFEKGTVKPIYNWVLANPVKFEKPIPNVKGKLSFWNYDLSQHTKLPYTDPAYLSDFDIYNIENGIQ